MSLLQTIFASQLSVNDQKLSVISIAVKSGDIVKLNQVIAQLESSKTTFDVIAPIDGYINVFITEEEDVEVGVKMFEIYSEKDDVFTTTTNEFSTLLNISDGRDDYLIINTKFSQEAEKLLNKQLIDKNSFNSYSFVTTNIINQVYNSNTNEKFVENKKVLQNQIELIESDKYKIQKLLKSKITESEYLSAVNSSGLVSRLSIFIKLNNLNVLSKIQSNIRSTPLPLIIYEVSKLLIKYPNLNSFFYEGTNAQYTHVNVGYAIDDGHKGLKVIAIPDSNNISLSEIEDVIIESSIRYNNDKLTLNELTSSTFTISDLFSSNIFSFHPLVNNRNTAILGISSYQNSGFILDLSFDHRITSGNEVTEFLTGLKERLESKFELFRDEKDINTQNIKCLRCMRRLEDDFEGKVYFQKVVNSKVNGYICSLCYAGY